MSDTEPQRPTENRDDHTDDIRDCSVCNDFPDRVDEPVDEPVDEVDRPLWRDVLAIWLTSTTVGLVAIIAFKVVGGNFDYPE